MSGLKVIHVEQDVTLCVGVPTKTSNGRKLVYHFDKLQPGMYLEFGTNHPGSAKCGVNKVPRVSSPAYSYARRHGWKVSVEHTDLGTTRVYRTK